MRDGIRRIAGIVAGSAAAGVLMQTAVAADMACGKPMTTEQKVQRALDILEIQNVTSLHEYYHNALMHCEELANVWARKTPGITWTNNTDKYIGEASVQKFYCDGVKHMPTTGALWYHMLTTPVVEVAGDGKTAKAIYMSFGNVSGAMGPDPKGAAQWTQEKYGFDLVKEDGRWKIWHLRTYVDFYSPFEKSWLEPGANIAAPGAGQQGAGALPQGASGPPAGAAPGEKPKLEAGIKEEPGVSFQMATPDEKGEFYEGYNIKRVPKLAPDLPTPYCTFSEVKPY
jgi:hypothetical protein